MSEQCLVACFLAFPRIQIRVLMRVLLNIAAVIFLWLELAAPNTLSTERGHISFYSKAPVADVDAQNANVKISLNTKDGELTIDMNMSDFQFKSEKMEKDAENKYLETVKFTKAGFKGKILGKIDYDKAGTYDAVAVGKLRIHGVERDFKEKGVVMVGGKGHVKIQTAFMLALKDFNISTPKILGKKMTQESVKVSIEATLTDGKDTAYRNKK